MRTLRLSIVLVTLLCLAACAPYVYLLTMRPETAEDLIERGALFLRHRHYQESLDCFDNALELDPNISSKNRGKFHYCKGVAYYELGRYEEAITELTARLSKIKTDRQALYYRGLSYYELGCYTLAVGDLKKSCDYGLIKGCEAYELLWPFPLVRNGNTRTDRLTQCGK